MTTDLREQLQATLGNAYTLERELGGGGMSRVFTATERALGRKVVVKVLPPELTEGLSTERFRREVLLADKLQHPAIVPVLTAGIAGALPYYTMPFVDGESLRQRIARGPLPLDAAIDILRDVASALDYAHAHGVVHRDIKPDNILLSSGRALVADFGIARALRQATQSEVPETLTATGFAIGTPAYMSPEQALGDKDVGAPSDVYSLACVTYEMLAGQSPFAGPSGPMMARRFTGRPPTLSSHQPDLPRELDAVLARAMALDPAERHGTAGEFARELEQAALGAPGAGSAPTRPLPRGRSWRSPARAALVALAVVVLGGGWWLATRERSTDDPERKMLAVLPFKNMGQAEDAFFADGVTEEVTSRLANLHGLGVISRTSADQYKGTTKPLKQIAQELGVGYVLEGSVRWDKSPDGRGKVRVTPQLIRVADDSHIWADRLDADVTDVFQVQGTIAERVANALDVALREPERRALVARPTENFDAYSAYLQGRAAMERVDRGSAPTDSLLSLLARATQVLERAVALDSGFAEAHAMLGTARWHTWHYRGRTDEVLLEKTRADFERALRLRPHSPDVLAEVSGYEIDVEGNYTRANVHVERALELAPNNATLVADRAFIQWQRGDWKAALSGFARAVELDPLSFRVVDNAARFHDQARRHEDAERYLGRLIALTPDEPRMYVRRAWRVAALAGDTARARQLMQEVVRRFGLERATTGRGDWVPADWMWRVTFTLLSSAQCDSLRAVALPAFTGDSSRYYRWKAQLHNTLGEQAIARAHYDSAHVVLLASVRTSPNPVSTHGTLAIVEAALGRRDEALRAARRAVELAPLDNDRWRHYAYRLVLARVLARLGESDKAIAELEQLLAVPSYASAPGLRVDPTWDSLRSNPRFRRLVEATP